MTTTLRQQAAATRVRRIALIIHRYVGLVIAVFLLVAGLTGSLLAFYEELDIALSPELFEVAPPKKSSALLDPFELSQRIAAQLPADEEYQTAHLDLEPGRSVIAWVEMTPGAWREVFVDPYTGAIIGSRDWGNLGEGKKNLMPFIYRLHYSLALGAVGSLLCGLAALLWTLDCFVGVYLTFPAPARRTEQVPRRVWFVRWRPAWVVRANELFSFMFTWHRASGLWVWAMLLVFAWSAVALNLNDLYRPVMNAAFGMTARVLDTLPTHKKPYVVPQLSLRDAHRVGRRLMAIEAERRHFTVAQEIALDYVAERGAYVYRVRSDLDVSHKHPRTEVYFDGAAGRFLGFEAPTGSLTGNTLTTWLYALHFGAVGGLFYRVFVSAMGLAVAALSVSGVWIWWRKRQKRVAKVRHALGRDQAKEAQSMLGCGPAPTTRSENALSLRAPMNEEGRMP